MLLLVTILDCSLVIRDAILTPSISVLSAVSGIKQSAKSLDQSTCTLKLAASTHYQALTISTYTVLYEYVVVGISVVILILLFSAEQFGTDKVGYSFAPIIILWCSFIAGIGLYNIFKYDIGILRAFNPKYIVDYFQRNHKHAWVSLGGVVLCIT
ncbi:hypothetical protein IFM89_021252 [Coptis chinensis]|uniref:K+ potassium transporter integral membrane domain-containing protein n=1 Tax=Coptis chinensis TaxID=261450 RepID=A0A835IBB8_9MAGN|nr:hypothetical protein IFM89_021252 [Coptis chinensis]